MLLHLTTDWHPSKVIIWFMSYRYEVLPLERAAAPESQSQLDEREQRTTWASSQGAAPGPERTCRKKNINGLYQFIINNKHLNWVIVLSVKHTLTHTNKTHTFKAASSDSLDEENRTKCTITPEAAVNWDIKAKRKEIVKVAVYRNKLLPFERQSVKVMKDLYLLKISIAVVLVCWHLAW